VRYPVPISAELYWQVSFCDLSQSLHMETGIVPSNRPRLPPFKHLRTYNSLLSIFIWLSIILCVSETASLNNLRISLSGTFLAVFILGLAIISILIIWFSTSCISHAASWLWQPASYRFSRRLVLYTHTPLPLQWTYRETERRTVKIWGRYKSQDEKEGDWCQLEARICVELNCGMPWRSWFPWFKW
jgi:hypothetical protein